MDSIKRKQFLFTIALVHTVYILHDARAKESVPSLLTTVTRICKRCSNITTVSQISTCGNSTCSERKICVENSATSCSWSAWEEDPGSTCALGIATRSKLHPFTDDGGNICSELNKIQEDLCKIGINCTQTGVLSKSEQMINESMQCNISVYFDNSDGISFRLTTIRSTQKIQYKICEDWSEWEQISCKDSAIQHNFRKRSCRSSKLHCPTTESKYHQCKYNYSNGMIPVCSWSSWGACSKSCDGKSRIRKKSDCSIYVNNTNNIKECDYENKTTHLCEGYERITATVKWSDWGNGTRYKKHCNGSNCFLLEEEEQKCKVDSCNEWIDGTWESCQSNNVWSRYRKQKCRFASYISNTSFCLTNVQETQYLHCRGNYTKVPDAKNPICEWGSWGTCSRSCGESVRRRDRSTCLLHSNNTNRCNISEAHIRKACAEFNTNVVTGQNYCHNHIYGRICINLQQEAENCSRKECNVFIGVGQWNTWEAWASCTNCSGTCNTGFMTCARKRSCSSTQQNQCTGKDIEQGKLACSLQPCLESAAAPSVTGPILGAIGSVIVIVFVIVMMIVLFKRRRHNKKESRNAVDGNHERNRSGSNSQDIATYDELCNRRSQHVYGKVNETTPGHDDHEYSSVYDCKDVDKAGNYLVLDSVKTDESVRRDSVEPSNNYYNLEGNGADISKDPNKDDTLTKDDNYFILESKKEGTNCTYSNDGGYFILERKEQQNSGFKDDISNEKN